MMVSSKANTAFEKHRKGFTIMKPNQHKQSKIKSLLVLALALVMSLSALTGCTADTKKGNVPKKEPTAQTQTKDETKKSNTKKDDVKKDATKKDDAKKADTKTTPHNGKKAAPTPKANTPTAKTPAVKTPSVKNPKG